MQDIVKTDATYADLEAVPEHLHLVAELINGKLVTHPRPIGRHGRVHTRMISVFGPPFMEGLGGPGGWELMTEPELHFGRNVTVPEIAGWRVERIDPVASPHPLDVAKIRLVPDWVCEVLSPSTEKYDRGEKQGIYGDAGVQHLWLVDPRLHLLEAYALDGDRWKMIGSWNDDAVVRIAPFDAFEFRLGRIWPPRT